MIRSGSHMVFGAPYFVTVYPFMQDDLEPLLAVIQRNCDISDARHAGDYTLCIYLLKMREYFRWEKGYSYRDSLPGNDVSDWITDRETFWQTVEDEPFGDLPINGRHYDPFDNHAINKALNPLGLIYSSGIGNQRRPHFFLGELFQQHRSPDFTILVSKTELARDLAAPPAMTRSSTIFIRRETLRQITWEKVEEWRWNKPENAMAPAINGFDLEGDTESALEEMTDALMESVLLHEKGEVLAGQRLGDEWENMLSSVSSKTEIMIRAVRDHLADSLTTLPGLLEQGKEEQLHLYFANLSGMRKHLFPALTRAYEAWVTSGRNEIMEKLPAASELHWETLANQMLEIYRNNPDDLADQLEAIIEAGKFEGLNT